MATQVLLECSGFCICPVLPCWNYCLCADIMCFPASGTRSRGSTSLPIAYLLLKSGKSIWYCCHENNQGRRKWHSASLPVSNPKWRREALPRRCHLSPSAYYALAKELWDRGGSLITKHELFCLISCPDWPAEASVPQSPNTVTQSTPSDAKVLCSPESLPLLARLPLLWSCEGGKCRQLEFLIQ